MRNALTIDVEDYFHVSAFEGSIDPVQWESLPQRVARNTFRILDLLEEKDLRATFFILGWVAERHPDLVRRIADSGHEVACHGYSHQRLTTMTPDAFEQDVRRARGLLQDISGQPVDGYRAPSYTIIQSTLWALDVLIDAGFRYDSSIFPIRHDLYGLPGAERFIHDLTREKGTIREFPPTTVSFDLPFTLPGMKDRHVTLPVSGGGYLRLLPARWISAAFSRLNADGHACVLYFHPWEIDPHQPRIKAPLKSRLRHYLNLDRTESKLQELFSRHTFTTMSTVLFGGMS